MKIILYCVAVVLAVVTAIGYVVGKGWEEEARVGQIQLSKSQLVALWSEQAKAGDPEAQYQLGRYYDRDRVDYLTAQKWYRVAATRGNHAGAQYKLGQLYLNGRGVENNLPNAMMWFRKAAEGGDARGQYFLGVSQRDGWERKPDFIEAYKWFLLANRDPELVLGEEARFDPQKALLELDAVMSEFDRAEAQKRADKWQPR